jgi:hypothetical protein
MSDLAFGLTATVVGLGIVLGVLGVLWVLLTLLSRLDRRGPDSSASSAGSVGSGGAGTTTRFPLVRLEGDLAGLDPRLVAAVTVAILRHEEARRLQAAPAMRSYWPGSLLFASRWVAAGRTRQGQSWHRRR